MENLINCSDRLLWIVDTTGKIANVRGKNEDSIGYSEKELIGKNIIKLFPVEEQHKLFNYFKSHSNNTSYLFESNLISKESILISCKINLSTIKIHNDDYFLFCIRENKLERILYYDLINRIHDNTIDDLILGIMHEINNPNNFLMLNIPYLQNIFQFLLPIVDEYYKKNPENKLCGFDWNYIRDELNVLMGDINMGINRIKRITSSLTDFLVDETSMDEINLLDVINSTSEDLKENLKSEKINLYKNYDKLKRIKIRGNSKSLKSAISNIIHNSIESFENSVLEKCISIQTKLHPGSQSSITTITDTGCGIPSESIFKIFNPFYTTKRDKNQVGLGLYIAKYIIKKHGGQIFIESEPDKWTKITVKLPYLTACKGE